ncbi:hypothetical protein [Parafannyhessea umbonata]|uniref:Uncharacterized protein n=1 Tax=Parafannyhessea umbonata TaxID=604330 RepID=A0A1G6IW50_9ACTN|nr:hypothetical protein [Parafannyhessea umbonata]SDC10812.1 hypothetical protein SAMN04487824_10393 [Parafannyhessea umbonata]
MDGEANGGPQAQDVQGPQTGQRQRRAEGSQSGRPQAEGAEGYERAIAERDERIAALETQAADAAKSAEAADELRAQIAEQKARGESDRIDFSLRLVGVRNVKAVRGVQRLQGRHGRAQGG